MSERRGSSDPFPETPTIVVRELQEGASVQLDPELEREMDAYEKRRFVKRRDSGRTEGEIRIIKSKLTRKELAEQLDAARNIFRKRRKAMDEDWKTVESSIKRLSQQSCDFIFPTDPEFHKILDPRPEISALWLKGWKFRIPGFFGKMFGESAKIAKVREALVMFVGSGVCREWEKARDDVVFRTKQLGDLDEKSR